MKLSLFLVFTFIGRIGMVVTVLEDIVFFLWCFLCGALVGVAGVLCGCWLAWVCGFFVGAEALFLFFGDFFKFEIVSFLGKSNVTLTFLSHWHRYAVFLRFRKNLQGQKMGQKNEFLHI